jgi:alpha-tubulin suppressor-like RCC1 family protein
VRVRRVCAGDSAAFAIGENGEFFPWGSNYSECLGHDDTQDQPSPKRVEALRGVRVSSVSVGASSVLALAEDGLVYVWGCTPRCFVGYVVTRDAQIPLLPTPIEALRGVRMGSIAASVSRNYAVADTGELWAWGDDSNGGTPIGHGRRMKCPLPEPIESLDGIRVDVVAAAVFHTMALADDGRVYTWGDRDAALAGALGLGRSVSDADRTMRRPHRVRGLRGACGGACT